ncbi:hypothetical protein NP493_926g02039 [Ridgeia piscesae]|uniref:Methyltransferase domain-containing protein n=1 Tax=Ridgeia piscesae TaxID=27915 RepID=A0AAD9KKD1_RIDPI|nr:hypothetical protein NP493_926g02039 [Ridgeia piscesae]
MTDRIVQNHIDPSNLFHSREQFLTHPKSDNFKETLDYYKDWANTYEEELAVLGYHAHTQAAEYLAKQQQPKDVRILDAACGTGLCGHVLRDQYGYKHIDGLDASADMLEVARARNIYEHVYCARLGDGHTIPIDNRKWSFAHT